MKKECVENDFGEKTVNGKTRKLVNTKNKCCQPILTLSVPIVAQEKTFLINCDKQRAFNGREPIALLSGATHLMYKRQARQGFQRLS